MSRDGRAQAFRDLVVWQKAHQLTPDVYRTTADLPGEERYGLVAQMRSAAISIESNIAEGCGRGAHSELARFLQIARGSASELECQILVAKDLSLLSTETCLRLESSVTEIQRMLSALRLRVRAEAPELQT